jgi:hypothetical protein
MLQQFGNGSYHAQIGWIEQPFGNHHTLIELEDPLTQQQPMNGYPYERCDVPQSLHYLQCFNPPNPPPGTSTYYTVEYHPDTGDFDFYMQQPGSARQLVARAPAHFTANQAIVAGETHRIYDQMPGTPGSPEVFSDAHVFNRDGSGWENLFGHTTYNGNEVFHTPQTEPWYATAFSLPGSPHAKSGQLIKVWDADT